MLAARVSVGSTDADAATVSHFALHPRATAREPGQLRWWRCDDRGPVHPVSLRDAIAVLESYEPIRSLTAAVTGNGHLSGQPVSVSVLRAELKRVLESPIVLNRALREAVLERVERGDLSMSEIAIRCRRVKPTAENVEHYLSKGSRVAVDGRLEWREWETTEQQKRQAVSIIADVVQFLDSPGERDGELVGAGSSGGEDELGF